MEFKPKAKSTARPIPIPRRAESPTVVPLPPDRALLAQGLQRLTSTPVQSQRQAAHPVLQAAGLRRQEEQRTLLQRQALEQARTVHLPAETTQQVLLRQQAPPPPIPRQPQSAGDWVTVMRAQAEQIEGRVTSAREAAQFSALQRQVAQTLVQGFRADRRPAQERHDSYAAHLVALQRHPNSASVAGVVLGLIPQGERPALQRAVDLTLQREQAQAAQDQQALEALAIQRQLAELDAEATQPVLQRIQARRGGGNPLPTAVQRHLEQGLNHDLSQVRIHDDAEADKLAKGVNAVAFTTGTDIFFRRGQFNPNTQTGLELLAHEVTHTVQQSRGQVGTGIDPDAGLEREASTMGRRLANIKGIASKLEVDQTFRRPLLEGPWAIQRQKGASLVGDAAEITRLERRLKGLNADMALTMTQAAADVAGIVDPTPISDGISAAINLYRGDFLGAGLSVLSMIPGLGDAIAKPLQGSKLALKLAKLEKEIKLVTQQLAKATGKSLQTVEAAAKASRNVVKAEVLTRLPKNWTKIRGVIGKKYSRSILPSDYYEKIINGKPVIFRKPGLADDALVAPLSIENGKLVMKQATERLSDPVLMRANFKAKYGRASKPGYQIHHLVPDNLVRSHPLGQAAERLGVNLDRGNNLVELPGKTAHVTEGAKDVGHWSSHPKYDAIVTPLLTASQKALEKAYGSLDAVPKDVMEKTMDGIASRLNDLIRQKKVPLTKDGRLAAVPIPSSVQTA